MILDVISKKTFETLYNARKKGIFSFGLYGVVEIVYTNDILHQLTPVPDQEAPPLPVFHKIVVPGTEFQAAVWRHLLSIQQGETQSYSDVARAIGRPKAFRAVGQAVGANPIGILIPCHRVLAQNKKIGGFAWGTELKRKWLSIEKYDN
ncbi:MAG: MGMT family protein [Candidatus Paracaedibacteraceae bacterium]|nr:MGMT family protein [Candidatus Paracaedibacteraceae bacterium]